jgi:hypothetical protein
MLTTWIKNIAWIYIVWILLHYIAPHLYVNLCVPATTMGFVLSPLYAPAIHCKALRWVIYQGGEVITTMWIVIGSWVIKKLMISNCECDDKMNNSERCTSERCTSERHTSERHTSGDRHKIY